MVPVQLHAVPARGDNAGEAREARAGAQHAERPELQEPDEFAARPLESGDGAGRVLKHHGLRFAGPARQSWEELRQGDAITTLSINHIPIDLGKEDLLALLDETGFEGHYDYLYLPCNYREGTNRGHAFVNLCTPDDAKHFFAVWHGARLFGDGAKDDGSLLSISVCTEQGFESCVARWTEAKMRRLKKSDFIPFIRTGW